MGVKDDVSQIEQPWNNEVTRCRFQTGLKSVYALSRCRCLRLVLFALARSSDYCP